MVYKFKKGDRVRILDGSTIKNYTYGWAPDMRNYVGYEVTIQSFNSDENNRPSYYLDDIPYKWDERGLLLIDSEDDNIKKVIFNDPATIVLWEDGTKTVVKCQDGDIYSKELGLAMCISKKYLGNKGNFNEVFKKWIPEKDDSQGEEETPDPVDEKIRLSREALLDGLKSYCYGTHCLLCDLRSDCEKVGKFETLTDSQLSDLFDKAYKKEED